MRKPKKYEKLNGEVGTYTGRLLTIGEMSKESGIDRTTIWRWMERLGIEPIGTKRAPGRPKLYTAKAFSRIRQHYKAHQSRRKPPE